MAPGTSPDLTEIEGLLARAEADLAGLKPRDPSDPADPARCLEIWIAALRAMRASFPPTADRPPPRKGGPPCRTPRAPPWRAVGQDGTVLDVLVQSRRDKRAADRLLRK